MKRCSSNDGLSEIFKWAWEITGVYKWDLVKGLVQEWTPGLKLTIGVSSIALLESLLIGKLFPRVSLFFERGCKYFNEVSSKSI